MSPEYLKNRTIFLSDAESGRLARWLSVLLLVDVEFYSGDGIADPTIGVPTCTIETDTDGSIVSCTATTAGLGFDISMVGTMNPTDRIYIKFDMQSNHGTDLYIGPISGDPTFTGAFDYGEDKCGDLLLASGAINNFEARWEMNDTAAPDTTYALSADFELTESAPTCLYPALP